MLGRQNKATLACFLVLTAGLLYLGFKMVAAYLLAVVMGAILSILFHKVFVRVLAKTGRPKVAATVVTIGIAVLVLAPIFLFAVMAITQAIQVSQYVASQPGISLEGIAQKLTKWSVVKSLVGDAEKVKDQIIQGLKNVGGAAPGVVFSIFGGLPEFVLQVFLGLLSCYFFLLDGGRFLNWLRDKLPLDPEVRSAIFTSFKDTSVSSIVATISAASVQSVIMVTSYLLLGVPAAFLAGGLTFIFAWVPLLGSTPIWITGAAYLFINGSTTKGLLMIGAGMLTGVSDNLVYPLVLKGRGELHPLVSLVAIFGGIQLFGIFGVFLGPIIAALIISAMNVWPMLAERAGFFKGAQIIAAPTDVRRAPDAEEEELIRAARASERRDLLT